MHASSRFLKRSFLPLLAVAFFFSLHVSRTDAITCSPPTIVTGCTEQIIGADVLITATVPIPSGTLAPTVETDPALSITATTATLFGAIDDTGGASATLVGFSYGLTTTYDTTTLNSGSFDVGSFSASIAGLTCETTYHFRAYATNPVGTGYGGDLTFTTAACPIIPDIIPTDGDRGHGIPGQSTVNFLGTAYPGAHVVILSDGGIVTATTAGPDGSFVSSVAGIEPGFYVFSAYAQDTAGRLSVAYSFPLWVAIRSIVTVNGMLLPPTIAVAPSSVAVGGTVTVTGAAAPNSLVKMFVASSSEQSYSTVATGSGTYSFSIDTTGFDSPTYSVRTQMQYGGRTSPFSRTLLFRMIGVLPKDTTGKDKNGKNKDKIHTGGYCGIGQGDLNCDGRVDIIDFTIMKSWYRKENAPAIVDLSGDGEITLTDFSILASDWTG